MYTVRTEATEWSVLGQRLGKWHNTDPTVAWLLLVFAWYLLPGNAAGMSDLVVANLGNDPDMIESSQLGNGVHAEAFQAWSFSSLYIHMYDIYLYLMWINFN